MSKRLIVLDVPTGHVVVKESIDVDCDIIMDGDSQRNVAICEVQ